MKPANAPVRPAPRLLRAAARRLHQRGRRQQRQQRPGAVPARRPRTAAGPARARPWRGRSSSSRCPRSASATPSRWRTRGRRSSARSTRTPRGRIVRRTASFNCWCDASSARSAFASVAELGSGVGGDLALNVTVDELLHDTAAASGRLELTVELVDRTTRSLVARRRFSRRGAGRTGERARRRRGAEPGADERARRTRAVARGVRGEAARDGLALTAAKARCATRARAGPRHATSSAAS